MKHTESKIQSECVKWFRLFYRRYTPLLFAVPNGGARNRITGAILKSEGVIPGVADMILLLPRGGYHALCIEMKTETGRQSESQKAWQKAVELEGYRYAVCRSVREFVEVVMRYIENTEISEK